MASMSKRWCYTVNNYEADEAMILLGTPAIYHIMGKEMSATGTPHLQGYIIFESNKRLSGVKKIHPTAHWEVAKGTTDQNIKYCSKEGSYEEIGKKPLTSEQIGQTEKERWKLILQHAKAGTLEEHDPQVYYRTYATAEKLAARHAEPEDVEKNVNVYWGGTGTGKSYDAWKNARQDGCKPYGKDPRSKFWYGYDGQKNVVMDEFRGGIDISHLLRWLDHYPLNVEIKGSSMPLKAQNIWITSNIHPKDWYPDLDEETKQALLRRMHITHYWGVLGKDVTKTYEEN